MKTFKILSIDAWADCCGCECENENPQCWTWNQWYTIGTTKKLPETLDEALTILDEEAGAEFKQGVKLELDDDGHNLVIRLAENQKPYFAFEYGSQF